MLTCANMADAQVSDKTLTADKWMEPNGINIKAPEQFTIQPNWSKNITSYQVALI